MSSFLDTMDDENGGGEDLRDRIYLKDKNQPSDMVVELIDFGIDVRDESHHKYPGDPFFAAELKCLDKTVGQPSISDGGDEFEGTVFSLFKDMRAGLAKTHAEFVLKDIASFLAAVTGRPKNYFLERGKIRERIDEAAADAEEYAGMKLQLKAMDGKESKKGSTFYNPTWIQLD